MTEAQMRADMLMARLIQRERALGGYATASRSCAEGHSTTRGRTNTWTNSPRFTGEHKDWPEWSFQFSLSIHGIRESQVD